MLRRHLAPLLAATLTADTRPEKRFNIYFVGDSVDATKKSHAALIRSIDKYQPSLTAKTRITYVQPHLFSDDIDTGLRQIAQQQPDLVIGLNGKFAAAARRVFNKTPLIFSTFDDPIDYGIVTHLHTRVEPVCGISLTDTLDAKRLEILKQAFPRIQTVAVMADDQWATVMGGRQRIERDAAQQGLRITVLQAEDPHQIQMTLARLHANSFEAWYVPATTVVEHSTGTLINQFHTWKAPNIWTEPAEVEQGALMAYSQDTRFVWESLVELISRVLSGEYPGNIPILHPTNFALTVRVAPNMAYPTPHISIVRRAARVIR